MFTVETGAVVANANSLVSVADADAYFLDRNNPSTWYNAATEDKEKALIYATMWFEGRYGDRLRGNLKETAEDTHQTLSFPREYLVESNGREHDDDLVPPRIKDVICELAFKHLELSSGLNPSFDRGGAIRREQVDVISVEYFDRAIAETTFPYIERLVRPFLAYSGASIPLSRS